MSRIKPTKKRRGGVRDDSDTTIGLNRRELAELLERIRRRCDAVRKPEDPPVQRGGRR